MDGTIEPWLTLGSVLLAALALFVTAYQIALGRRQLRARSIYEIQRDARAAALQLLADPDLAPRLFGREVRSRDRALAGIGQLFNFYASVWQQHRMGVIDGRLWAPFRDEVETLLRLPLAREFWATKVGTQAYDGGFEAVVEAALRRVTGSADDGRGEGP